VSNVAHYLQNADGLRSKVNFINSRALKDKHYHEIILLRL